MSVLAIRARKPSTTRPTAARSSGLGVPVAAKQGAFRRPRADLFHPAEPIRARRLLGAELRYIAHPSFDDPQARDAIVAPMPASAAAAVPRRGQAPEGLATYLVSLDYDNPILSREQEAHLFRKMNYLVHCASVLRERVDAARASAAQLDDIERHLNEALAIKTQIVRANLRLVVAIARRYARPGDDLLELVSDGNLALMRAVERFDFSRGNKFSTYATWTIRHEFVQTLRKRARFFRRLHLCDNAALANGRDPRTDDLEHSDAGPLREAAIARWLEKLDVRSRRVIVGHYGIGDTDKRTLAQLGEELGISKERVRQIELSARKNLRQRARTEDFVLLRT